eukprot:CAMPEP_0172378526 /NCGR_PEP_ID=MMETSP1060-20121228/69467_1 /TAXON_ID=37318 /ORGANISM="Pseudo-nitzschia pungens, Strain cf. cingulata" /LENGTH=438 /DNA_ID=CAMNT_0013106247 /DNA_START=690 /DNA_END=2006 /DNA_ORIENTATION=+
MATEAAVLIDNGESAPRPQHRDAANGSRDLGSPSSEPTPDESHHNDVDNGNNSNSNSNSNGSNQTEQGKEGNDGVLQYLEDTANDVAQQIGGEMKRVSFWEFVYLVRATLCASKTSPRDRTEGALLLLESDVAQPHRWKSVMRTIYASSLDRLQNRKDPPGLFYKTTLRKLQNPQQQQQQQRPPQTPPKPSHDTSLVSQRHLVSTTESFCTVDSGMVSTLSLSSMPSMFSLASTTKGERTREVSGRNAATPDNSRKSRPDEDENQNHHAAAESHPTNSDTTNRSRRRSRSLIRSRSRSLIRTRSQSRGQSRGRIRNRVAPPAPTAPTRTTSGRSTHRGSGGNRVEIPEDFEVFAVNNRNANTNATAAVELEKKLSTSNASASVTTVTSSGALTIDTDTNQLAYHDRKGNSRSGRGRGGLSLVRRLLGKRSTGTPAKNK